MKVFSRVALSILAAALTGGIAHAHDCVPGRASFTLINTRDGFVWRGIGLSLERYDQADALPRQPAAPKHDIVPVSLVEASSAPAEQHAPSFVRNGIVRLSSNVASFRRKFTVTFGSIDAADLSFCSNHQLNLHCGEIVENPIENAVAMRCSLVIFDVADIVTP